MESRDKGAHPLPSGLCKILDNRPGGHGGIDAMAGLSLAGGSCRQIQVANVLSPRLPQEGRGSFAVS